MKIYIKNKVYMPIYEQIKEQIKSSILDGSVKENEQLVSIRQLAKDLNISAVTTTKAYSELEEEGFIKAIAGKGYYVASKNNELLREMFLKSVKESLHRAVRDGINAGLTNEEIIAMLKSALSEHLNE